MKRKTWMIAVWIPTALLLILFTATAKERKNVSGVWDCQSHGGNLGDLTFTLTLQQDKENVDGTINSPLGSTQVTAGSFKHYQLELHFDLPQGTFTLMAHMEKGKLVGAWSMDSDKGAWEGVQQADSKH